MVLYFPAVQLAADSPRYARAGGMPLFGDFWMPAGYPILLLLLRTVSDQMWFTIAVQHLFGVGSGLLLYLGVWRLGLRRGLACVPAAAAWLSGDHLYLEHSVMADFLLTFLVAAGLCAAVFGFTAERGRRWLAVASTCLAAAALVRTVGVPLLPILAVSAVIWSRGLLAQRALTVASAVLPGLMLFAFYFAGFKVSGGQYLGLSDMRGWNLYSRVAPFANCRKFVPPDGTAVLCENRRPQKRPGPFGYVWDLESVPRKMFPLNPETGRQLEAFAYSAILHQPKDYARAVLIDLARYIVPSAGRQPPFSGQPREILSFGWRDNDVENMVVRAMTLKYRGAEVVVRAPNVLAGYQNIMRMHGFFLAILALLTVVGMWLGKDRVRVGIFLFGLSAFALYFVPVGTLSYDFRYGIPPETFLLVSGLLGAAGCFPGTARGPSLAPMEPPRDQIASGY